MDAKRTILSPLSLAVMLAAAGCGGGGSGSGNGGAGSNPPPGDPPPVAEKITITGQVTDMPIPNATVVVTVDGQSFEAPLPTDVDGFYEVEIESTDPDAMVLCEAYDPNGAARFSAMLNDFAGLQDLADADGTVPEADITNVTTAQFVLATRLTDDGTIDSLEELEEVAEQVDTDDLLELSAAIKLVVESIDGITLPADIADTLELAEAIVDGSSTFLEDVAVTNPGALEEAIDLVLTDGNATVEFDADAVPGVYLVDETFTIYALFADGTGLAAFFDEGVVDVLPSWSVNDAGALEMDFMADLAERDTVTLINQAGNVLSVSLLFEELGEGGVSVSEATTMVRFGFDAEFDPASIPASYTTEEDPNEFKVFLEDGTGYDIDALTGVQDDFFTWEAVAPGTLVIESENEAGVLEVETVYVLEGTTDTLLNLLSVEANADGAVVDMEVFSATRLDEIVTGPMPDEANTALLSGKTYALTDELDVALFTFGADGAFSETAQFFEEPNGWEFYDDEGEWSVDENGVIVTVFPGDEASEGVTVVEGLGGELMSVLVEEDGQEQIETVTLVVPFNADTLPGQYAIVDASGQSTGEEMILDAGGSGVYVEDGVADQFEFEWSVDMDGRLVIDLFSGGFDQATDTFSLLADSTDTELHAVWVYRVNGQLDGDQDTSEDVPAAVTEVTLVRQQ